MKSNHFQVGTPGAVANNNAPPSAAVPRTTLQTAPFRPVHHAPHLDSLLRLLHQGSQLLP